MLLDNVILASLQAPLSPIQLLLPLRNPILAFIVFISSSLTLECHVKVEIFSRKGNVEVAWVVFRLLCFVFWHVLVAAVQP